MKYLFLFPSCLHGYTFDGFFSIHIYICVCMYVYIYIIFVCACVCVSASEQGIGSDISLIILVVTLYFDRKSADQERNRIVSYSQIAFHII